MNGRIAAGIGVLIVLLAGLVVAFTMGGGDDDPIAAGTTSTVQVGTTQPMSPSTSVPSTTVVETTVPETTLATTTTTTVDPNAPPYPDTADLDDAEAIWLDLMEYHNWIFQHPEQAELERYLHPDCACFDFVKEQIDRLAANGWREDDAGLVFDRLVVNVESEQGYLMNVFDRHVELRIVDEEGTVVETREARPLSWFTVTLFEDPDRGFVIREWNFIEEVGE